MTEKAKQATAPKAAPQVNWPEGKTRVAVFDTKPYSREFLHRANAEDEVELKFFHARLGPDTASLASGFSVVCAFVNDDLSAETIDALAEAGIGLIAMRCAGYNNVDIEAAAERDISVVRVPAYSPYAVAEHAVALMLTLNRKIHRAHNRVREANFSLEGLLGFDMHGKTAGVMGTGKIGQCLIDILQGFGCDVIGYDKFPADELKGREGFRYVDDCGELFAESDIISLHAPLTPETHHIINAETIQTMRDGVMVINTSRGALVDTQALVDGLKSRKIGSAGLDVYEEEGDYFFEDLSDQVITDDTLARLLTFPNVVITSHQGFFTAEALANIAQTTLANIAEYAQGKRGQDLTNGVCPKCE